MRKFFINTILVLFVTITLISCGGRQSHQEDPIELDISIRRFDRSLFAIDKYNVVEGVAKLEEQYGSFVQLFTNRIIGVGDPSFPDFEESLSAFLTDQTIYNTYNKVQKVYPDLDELEEQLSTAFGYYTAYFPNKDLPQISAHISGFNQAVATDESLISISLDYYLGVDEEMYNVLYPPLPKYARYTMHKDKIASDVMYAWALTEFEYKPEIDNMLAQMVYQGRAMYFVKQMLPKMNDTLIWGYNPDQLAFCQKHEKEMWTFLIENKLLFNSERFTISKYTDPAPFTKNFGDESPGRAVVWLGYQIIKNYMNKNSVSMGELMAESNYQQLLNLAGYNP